MLAIDQTHHCSPPLFSAWDAQYVQLELMGVSPGEPCQLAIDGRPVDFQYTGETGERGAVVMTELGFDADTPREFSVTAATSCATDLEPQLITLDGPTTIGHAPATVTVAAHHRGNHEVVGPIVAFADWPTKSIVASDLEFKSAELLQTNEGPIFTDYQLTCRFADHGVYRLRFRCYRHRPWVEVAERFALGMNGQWWWTLNPEGRFDAILSHRGPDFSGVRQPVVETIDAERPRDILCRLQMPVLNQYFVPNNRGWFTLFSTDAEDVGGLGILGLYGERWREPVANMPEVRVHRGQARWHASLTSGERHWLMHLSPIEREHTPQRRLTPHRLETEFNVLRLDDHLELDGSACYDTTAGETPAFFDSGDYHGQGKRRTQAIPGLKRAAAEYAPIDQKEGLPIAIAFNFLIDPSDTNFETLYDRLVRQFDRWVHQFKGYREPIDNYQKNTLGFARRLRELLIGYELLRRSGRLTDVQQNRLSTYFAFAGKRVADEARWPTSRTWLHPDHPESLRDLYTYGGEHKPDRLVWTNNLPNFQSDPMCALAHLAALFPEYGDADRWRRMAIDDIERQLTAYCGESGAWEESIIYACATLSYFLTTFRVLKHRMGIDYFHDVRVRRYVGWLCRYFGPYDKRFDTHSWPPIGNALMPFLSTHLLLSYAGELAEDDPLRDHCLAVYQTQADRLTVPDRDLCLIAAASPLDDRKRQIPKLASEHMDELGVAMRDRHTEADESYLFQKIGFWKDHYENDETAFNWHAKGTPLCMDFGTYTRDAALAAAHNLVEIPDQDSLRRGYLAEHRFTPAFDYTHCEMPVTLKLLWGRVRSFDEIDGNDATQSREKTPYHYIGDPNPVGPKTWKVRKLLWIKPDYLVLFDRVYGDVPHRYNLHVTADEIQRDGATIHAAGRFDLDLQAFIQHPQEFDFQQGEYTPTAREASRFDKPEYAQQQRQSWFRLYNHQDGIYRTLLFAKERGRPVRLESVGSAGIRITSEQYTDYVFMHDEPVRYEDHDSGVVFDGKVGWIRQTQDGEVSASLLDGRRIEAFGHRFEGRGPWTYHIDKPNTVALLAGPPREVRVIR